MKNTGGVSAKLFHRPMEPADIPRCVELIAGHPILGPRYGQTIEYLPEVWLNQIQREENTSLVLFTQDGPDSTVCFCGITAVVHDEFLRSMKTPPHFWTGPEMIRRFIAGDSPFLSEEELREGNSKGGLNLVSWDNCTRAGFEANLELQAAAMSGFLELHRGFRWKEIIANQPESPERLVFLLNTGAFLWDPDAGAYTPNSTEDPIDIVAKPHIVGTTSETEHNLPEWGVRWVSVLFDYRVPILGLSRSEQRLLKCAIRGLTDERVAETLGVSLPTVKKMWLSAYRRVADTLPELLSDSMRSKTAASGRGLEKRRALLSYLRKHPGELRPFSRKLLAKTGD